jgi:hypothetical protein
MAMLKMSTHLHSIYRSHQPKWVRLTALFLVGVCLQFLLHFFIFAPPIAIAKNPPPSTEASVCAEIVNPLTAEEKIYAQAAWKYFVKNYQPNTGFANAAGGYPSGTLWDLGNYLMALNAARWMNLIPQKELDEKLTKFLENIIQLKLFDDALPNKVYNTATGAMVNYGNKPVPRGIGWSALDIGRMLAAFHVLRTCHPQHSDAIKAVVNKWQIGKSIKDGNLYGALVKKDNSTLLVQEGRLGYEEYAVRGYELWGFKAPNALSFQPFKFVDIYGVQIPVDVRDYHSTKANNYVVSESYILDGVEFGLKGELAEYAARVLEVQKRRYEITGQLTAVTEDNINQPPFFIYNTIFANGVPWAAITEKNEQKSDLRTISTKAAFGWRYLYPSNGYAKKVFDAVKNLRTPENDGFYAGMYETTKKINTSMTGNTNGLIMEILYYKARGNRPLVVPGVLTPAIKPRASKPKAQPQPLPTPSPTKPGEKPSAPAPAPQSAPNKLSDIAPAPIAAVPIEPVTIHMNPLCPVPAKPLTITEQRYAKAAWQFFVTNVQASGLVNDRSFLNGATVWGLGDYLAALQAAHRLNVINTRELDERVRNFLGMLPRLPLFSGELPHRAYNTWSLQPVDYGNNPSPEGKGWSSLDVGRLLAALYSLKTCYPAYTPAVEKILLDWSYLRVVRDGSLYSANTTRDRTGRLITRVTPETRLGYEEYAARAFQMWGFDTSRSAVGGQYQMAEVEGVKIPLQRLRGDRTPNPNPYTISNPFLLYGLEFGLDPQTRAMLFSILQAQAERYRRTNIFTTAADTISDKPPYIVHNTAFGSGQAWATLGADGKPSPESRLVSTAAGFAFYALFPEDTYAQELWRATLDLYSAEMGYHEGFYEKNGETSKPYTGSTNSTILEALLYRATNGQPIVQPNNNLNSPWWQAITAGDAGQGLPSQKMPAAKFVTEGGRNYWVSILNPYLGTNGMESVNTPPPANTTTQPASTQPPVVTTFPAPNVTPVGTTTVIPAGTTVTTVTTTTSPTGATVTTVTTTTNPSPSPPPPPSPPAPMGPRSDAQPQDRELASISHQSRDPPATNKKPVERKKPTPTTTKNQKTTPVKLTPLKDKDLQAAKVAWKYFERNWNEKTGFVNSVNGYQWTTLWDQGSAIMAIHSARQLGLIAKERFQERLDTLLTSLEKLPIATKTKMPNKAYSTSTLQMRKLNDTPDPQGTSGWSGLDVSRLLVGLHTLKTHYPEYRDRINRIVARWDVRHKLVKNGQVRGGFPKQNGTLETYQEGRLGYEQYAAYGGKYWGLDTSTSLDNPPVKTVKIDGIPLQVDQRDLKNSGASNYLTSDPYLLWGIEIGWSEAAKKQAANLFKLQAQRYHRTGIVTAVNEDGIDRPPYFLYYSVYCNGQPWQVTTDTGKPHPELKFVSTKAAFGWSILMPDDPYAKILRSAVQGRFDPNYGYISATYERPQKFTNKTVDVNTNAVILESLLYRARGNTPLISPS